MTDRNRAWRRRKARLMFWKGEENKKWLGHEVPGQIAPGANSSAVQKQHQHGKLTHAQELRLAYSLNTQMADGFDLPQLDVQPEMPIAASA